MKPLLRVVLIVDALMLLAFGVLFLLTPWTALYDALQLVQAQPALVGQAFGVVLAGFGWLALRAAFDGAMTATLGRTVGHVFWIAGVLLLVWLIGLHTPRLTGFGQLVAGGVGVWLIVIGFGSARLASVVRRRDRALAAQAAAARRDTALAAKDAPARQEPVVYATPVFAGVGTSPADPAAFAAERPAPPVPPVPGRTAASAPARTVVEPEPGVPADAPTPRAPLREPHGAADAREAARDEAAGAPRPPLRG